MPKPAVHHTHLTGAVGAKSLIELCYYDYVYYSEKNGDFFISKTPEFFSKNGKSIFDKGEERDSYIKCNDLRSYWTSGNGFDEMLLEKFTLRMP